ncbi:MAG: hypothetical protein SF052_05185 [Bacteroidia bacterium]|nr:hypothetical protein [Bacteroidia bacterium]
MLPEIPGVTSGELKKFKIEAFNSSKRTPRNSPAKSFEVMFNPNSYSEKIQINFTPRQEPGNDSRRHVFNSIGPQDFQFEFLIDGTGASNSGNGLGVGAALPGSDKIFKPIKVEEKVKQFLDVCYVVEGKTHRPLYLILTWGVLVAHCVLKSADVNYTLFKPDGKPLRAKIKATFTKSMDDGLLERERRLSSPDLTHIRIAGENQNLPLMADTIYNDPSYYLQLARHNRLKHFRRLKTGQELQFPPLRNENE